MFGFYILGIVLIPLVSALALCELAFSVVYRRSPRFRAWFDDLCENMGD